jgi:hypothetical protein
MQTPPERLGSFYLGAACDLATGEPTPEAVHYDARHLTTHAICVGMTGSGKTGLCVDILEEAAIDSVPALIIDPKGGMTNLLLQFPELTGDVFEPWINLDDAQRRGLTAPEYAAGVAQEWREGLADWGIGPERMRLLGRSADFCVYTPGSDAGLPISITTSLNCPELDFASHAELLRERINGTAMALLGLVGIQADPLRSREAILLANIFEHFWRRNQDLDLATLIHSIQTPPVRQLGVFDVDTFYPEKNRFELAMAFNNLMAAPSYQSWLQGAPLDIDHLLYTGQGQPRHTIFYLAHLSDSERMFFVTLLLESVVTWMRRQTGTASLQALLYFDEIFGFFPATSEPPSKRPLLTLLKQARAYGLGCILAAQNPIDIDYKGLTNAGTWFIGKLQAERDKERVLHGLRGALSQSGQADRPVDWETLISRLGPRQFLLHSIYRPQPTLLQTRWAMSYLRGPLTKPEVARLMADRRLETTTPSALPEVATPSPAPEPARPTPIPAPSGSITASLAPPGFSPTPPTLDPDVAQVFLPQRLSEQEAVYQWQREMKGRAGIERLALIYEPAVLGGASVRFADRKRRINEQVERVLLTPVPDELGGVDWERAETLAYSLSELASSRPPARSDDGPFFASAPESANSTQELKDIERSLADWLYYHSRLTLQVHPELDLFQAPGEGERAFRIRLQQAARERRDAEVDALEKKYGDRIDRLEDRLRKQERDLIADEAEYDARKREEHLTMGETVLSFFMGRRRTRAVSTIATKRRLAEKAKLEIEETRDEIAELDEEMAELKEELEEEAKAITQKWVDLLDDVTTEEIQPRRSDVDVRLVALAWLPSWLITYDDGIHTRTATVAAYLTPAV